MASVLSIWGAIIIANLWFIAAQFIKDKKHFNYVCYVGAIWVIFAVIFGIAYRSGITWLG